MCSRWLLPVLVAVVAGRGKRDGAMMVQVRSREEPWSEKVQATVERVDMERVGASDAIPPRPYFAAHCRLVVIMETPSTSRAATTIINHIGGLQPTTA